MRTSNPFETGPIPQVKPLDSISSAIILFIGILVLVAGTAFSGYSQSQQQSPSIVIHDNTSAANGGEKATESFRNSFKSALEREKPCVETFDDQDLRDAINDERERAQFEGGDSDATLKAIGEKLGSRYVMVVKGMPGPGGTTTYSAFVLDTRTAHSVARRMGGEGEVAEGLVSDIGSLLADNCKPHWIGTVRYVYSNDETKTINDGGAAHAARKNVKRKTTQISQMQTNITANLLEPARGESVNSPMAMVAHRTLFKYSKSSVTSGENVCREPGKNPYYKGFSEEYTETTNQVGRATDKMPVFIEFADNGRYSIRVSAPSGIILGKVDTRSSHASCQDPTPKPSIEVQEFPPGKLMGTSFVAEGRSNPKKEDTLSGSVTLPDGKTKITWNLRLVKPKGK